MSSSSEIKNTLVNFLIPLEEIKSATNDFDKTNQIGQGELGAVYRGKLSERWGNRTAAIKRRNPNSYQGKDEFENEIHIISGFHHPNVISFIGYCHEGDERILVSEYAINGSLDHHLQDINRRHSLQWAQRLMICLGAARGLEYLHTGLGDNDRIIHREVKSANILLDENLEAKISDFGLSHTHVRGSVAGTSFYLDPSGDGNFMKQSDVYSLGVVLFETLSGMLVFHRRSIGGAYPHTLKNLVLQLGDELDMGDELDKITDPQISDQINSQSLTTFQSIAYKCISHNLWKRPTMDSIIKEIEKALVQEYAELVPSNYEEIIQRSDKPVVYENKGQIYFLLSAGILIDDGKKWFSLNETNRKNCLIISAIELFDDNDERLIGWDSVSNSRFSYVACFKNADFEFVHEKTMHVTAPMLSLESTYAVFLICKYKSNENQANTKTSQPDIHFRLYYGDEIIYPSSAEWKDEEWMEVELFQFTNHHEVANFELHLDWVKRFDYELYVEGIKFQPIEMATFVPIETNVERLLELDLDTYWEKKLPSDYEKIINKATNVLEYSTKKELYSLLVAGIYLYDNSMWFWLDASNEKKCFMLSSKLLSTTHDDVATNSSYNHHMSRFPETLQVEKFTSLEIRVKIKAHRLSPKTRYAAWLVYRVSKAPRSCLYIASLTLGNQEKKTRRVYLMDSSKTIRQMNDPEYQKGEYIRSGLVKLDRRFMRRDDGWYEVELFSFLYDMDAHDVVKVGLHIDSKYVYDHIDIEGIEFRPQ